MPGGLLIDAARISPWTVIVNLTKMRTIVALQYYRSKSNTSLTNVAQPTIEQKPDHLAPTKSEAYPHYTCSHYLEAAEAFQEETEHILRRDRARRNTAAPGSS